MATKIKIRLSRQEFETISTIITHAADIVDVFDVISLYTKEALEDLKFRFLSKQYKVQSRYQFSLTMVEMYIFLNNVGAIGLYEKAVCELIYNKQIAPQVSRAIQMRMGF
ncbi:MAG: hypothetical protein LBI45_05350 [Bacteroidales bacterium]|jgi:hypothetical protein|nr:hypothetical protein [Bacteroidales bacterium]